MKISVHRDYFEGVLQLRNCTEEIMDFVADVMKKEGNVWIAKEVKQKEGVDLFVSSNKFLKKIGRQLKEKFPGVMKSSSKLFTRDSQTCKNVYRGTVLFRMPKFRIGDVGIYKGDEVEIRSVGEKITLKDVKSGKKSHHNFDDVNKGFRKN